MKVRSALVCLVLPSCLSAQVPSDRLWGRVGLVTGESFEGFVRWDRNEASWADVLDGVKMLDPDVLDRVAEALGQDLDARGRSVEYLGVRISWDDDGDAVDAAESGIRFGHLAWLRPGGDDTALLGLRSGEEVRFRGGGTDLGSDLREVVVDVPGRGAVEVAWDELDVVEFGPAPPGVAPASVRLHGTVEDRWGDRWTGWISWDQDEALASDVLDGDDEDGRDREIPFGEIASVEPLFRGGATVRLRDGTAVVLRGTNDVDDGHRGVGISDPALGEVVVAWRDVRGVRFAPPAAPLAPWRDFDGGGRLHGVVETDDGERIEGRILWDADEAWSWELLNGDARGVEFRIEFARVARIVRVSSRSAAVVLRDGRRLVLSGSVDVDRGNKGIVVEQADGTLRVVEWSRFEAADFHEGASDGR